MKKLPVLAVLTAFFTSTSSYAGLFLLEEHNLVTVGNVDAQSLHVYESTLIGGNLNSTSVTFGERMVDFGTELNEDDTSLTVAGAIKATQGQSISAKGHVLVEQTLNNVVQINASQTKVNGTYVNNAKSVHSEDLLGTSDEILANLTKASDAFSAMDTNSEVVIENGTKHVFETNGVAANEYAVFSVDENSSLFNNTNNQEIQILTNELAGIIVNVAGTDIDFHGNFVGGSNNNYGNIIWNFYEALTIDLSSAFYGSILAPFAALTSANDIDGSVGVDSLSSRHSGQIHNQLNIIKPPVEVPEPSVWALILISCALLFKKLKRSS